MKNGCLGLQGDRKPKRFACVFSCLHLSGFAMNVPCWATSKQKGALTDEFHPPVSVMFIGGHVYNKAWLLKGVGFCFLSIYP